MEMNRTTGLDSFTRFGGVRGRILDSFVALMNEQGYEVLRIADILVAAGVGRTSFYAHFSNKEDLLRVSVERLKTGLARSAAQKPQGGEAQPLAFSRAFFRHVGSHRPMYHAIVGRDDFVVVAHHMRRMLVELIREDIAGTEAVRHDAAAVELAAQHVAGALWAVATWWMEQGLSMTADAVGRTFRDLALPGLLVLRKSGTPPV